MPSDSRPADRPATRVQYESLLALWRLSVRPGLSDEARIRAMLALACDLLGMELALLGDYDDGYTLRYVHDVLGVAPEGDMAAFQGVLCREIVLTGKSRRHDDLFVNPDYNGHPLVRDAGMRVYFGVPVRVDGSPLWAVAFLRRALLPALDEGDIASIELVADWLGNALYQSARAARLTRLALTDALTGLPNRRAAEETLQKEQARIERGGGEFGLALVDLDHFKDINDHYGHAVGDEVLRAVSRRFQSGLWQGDWVARWGGEEFLFFLHGSGEEAVRSTLQRIADGLKTDPPETSVGPLPLTLSAGVDRIAPGGVDMTSSLERLDAAMYCCKTGGRDRILPALAEETQWSARELRRALDEKRIRIAVQTIVDLTNGEAIADEALARLQTDAGEILAADAFIDQAEGMGLIAEIDRQVIRATMRRCASRLARGETPGFAHFVNVSPHFMARPDLVTEMMSHSRNYCDACGLAPEGRDVKPLVLELTERQRVVDLGRLRAELQPFIDFGYRLALDDFGSGYSSYLYLANLPVSFIKIEGWLVDNMAHDARVARIVASLADFARAEGLKTIAEHVEDASTADRLRELGVDYAQGYFFSRPQLVAA